jgi:hypothetical protein
MNNYIREQTLGDIISNTFHIYTKNFRVFFIIMLLPVIPLSIIEFLCIVTGGPGEPVLTVTGIVEFLITIFVTAPIAVAVSDYCLGNDPGVKRSYTRLTSVFWKFIGTFLLLTVLQIIGFMFLVVPGIILTVFFLFSMILVPLERRGGIDALKRSFVLGEGYRWRNLGVFFLSYLIFLTGAGVIGMIWGLLAALIVPESQLGIYFFSEISGYLGLIFGPISVIPLVLLYYDMRVRKENYDNAALAQDLMG